ncbi:MAG TPA: glycoside hydrolase family 99-like domain-containing protein, partial [Methylococcales bacterium]
MNVFFMLLLVCGCQSTTDNRYVVRNNWDLNDIQGWKHNADSVCAVKWKTYKWCVEQKDTGSLTVDGRGRLAARANNDECMILSPVDVNSAESNILHLRAIASYQGSIAFCWANDWSPGLNLIEVKLHPDRQIHSYNINLSKFEHWKGHIELAGFIFGKKSKDTLVLDDFSLSNVPHGEVEIELSLILTDSVVRRQGQKMELAAYIRNSGGTTFNGGMATLIAPQCSIQGEKEKSVPCLKFDDKAVVKWMIVANEYGTIPVTIDIDGKRSLFGSIRVEPAVELKKADYVPVPRPVATSPYQIGVYYFPGWAGDQYQEDRWQKQKGFPLRDPVLGFYKEGEPEVADWHIKWAAENGITFFMYDWYWANGRIVLEKGLENGYLKAKYRDYLKFCIMWTNHDSLFASHTTEQLRTVCDYWIKNYFCLDCYYKIDGKPVVSLFSPDTLRRDLGGSEKVKEAF